MEEKLWSGVPPLRLLGLIAGPAAFAAVLLFANLPPNMNAVLAVAALMAVWWLSEAVPLAATALLPVVLFPALGAADARITAGAYMNPTILLFLGGFLIAIAIERWALHRRIALHIILLFGVEPRRLILGFMAAAALLSMWISNTATALMLLPMALAIIRRMERATPDAWPAARPLLLGVAYACSIGGVATLIGSPPNLILRNALQNLEGQSIVIGFGQWMLFGLPLALALLGIAWLLLTRVLFRLSDAAAVDRAELLREKAQLGPLTREETSTLALFLAAALLWMFRSPIEIGALKTPGWSQWIQHGDRIDDATVAILIGVLFFLFPAGKDDAGRRRFLLEQDAFLRIPWSIVLLFGGGFALADAFTRSGLAGAFAASIAGLDAPPALLVALSTAGMCFLTELTSNTASAQVALPALAAVATAEGLHPLYLMLPATLAASMAFMLPVATPPNAIVFSSNRLRMLDMARAGLVLNLISIAAISVYVLLWTGPVFGAPDLSGD